MKKTGQLNSNNRTGIFVSQTCTFTRMYKEALAYLIFPSIHSQNSHNIMFFVYCLSLIAEGEIG